MEKYVKELEIYNSTNDTQPVDIQIDDSDKSEENIEFDQGQTKLF